MLLLLRHSEYASIIFVIVFSLTSILLSILFSNELYKLIQITSKLEAAQYEFITNVTHELRTPLTSIKGFIETLRAGAYKDHVTAERFLEIIDIESERLSSLIDDILLLSEVESGCTETTISKCNIEQVFNETMPVLSSKAEKKGISISSDIQKDLVLSANKDKIKQMLINLIDNAIKYNVEEGIVEVRAYSNGKDAVVSVKDTGIGISSECIESIFDRFYRVDKARSRNIGGTGLGLSIVKNIVKLYNGNIKVNSSLGEGTEFIITLPC